MEFKQYLKDNLFYYYIYYSGIFYKVNENPLFIFGNQKSGTSIIASLLAEATGKSLTLDFRPTYHFGKEIMNISQGKMDFQSFLLKHKKEFSKEIVKEPNLMIFYDLLKDTFHIKKSLFIVRDPRDNIRSILNRLSLSGNRKDISSFSNLSKLWQIIVGNNEEEPTGENYIIKLSERWNRFTNIYFRNKEDFILLKYEDFRDDKVYSIKSIIEQFELKYSNDISLKVDKQIQHKGDNSVSYLNFFGKENLQIINKICEDGMKLLQYL